MNTGIYECDICKATFTGDDSVDGKSHKELAPNTKCLGTYRQKWQAEDSFGVHSEPEAVSEVKRYREKGCLARYVKTGIGLNQYTHEEQFLYDVYYRYPATD